MANYIEITPLNSPYTLNFGNTKGLKGVVANQIMVKSNGGANALILGSLSNVEGLPKILVVCEDNTLDVYTTGTDCALTDATCGVNVSGISGLVGGLSDGCSAEIQKFISPAKNYWIIK
jgi:hypothetical protein